MAKVTIGADPEWGLMTLDGQQRLDPRAYIAATNGDDSPFGIDGSGRVAEIRPPYSDTPEGLVANIKKVFQDGINHNVQLQNVKWKAGSMAGDEPIGGHVHFGHKALIAHDGMGAHKDMRHDVTRALARIVAPLCIMAEVKEEAIARRVGTTYGALRGENCMRQQPFGIEYRSLHSWLTCPQDALAVLSISHLVATNLDNDSFISFCRTLPEMDEESYKDCDKKVASFYLKGIAKALKMADGFKSYLPMMEPLFDMVIEGREFDCEQDMKLSWGLKMPIATQDVLRFPSVTTASASNY